MREMLNQYTLILLCVITVATSACSNRWAAPVEDISLDYSESYKSFSEARRREAQLKRWTRAKKEALIEGDMEKLHLLSKPRK